MATFDERCDELRKLRAVGVIHYKCPDFEVTLGYPFGESAKQTREGGIVTPAPPSENAADLVLNPPDLAKVVED